jgi:Branched-chain amino acid aminotransferase/4-amino-4-deoxychorismate lyase
MGFTPTETIWFNGKLVPWGDAKVHVLAHGLQYGTGVFEGMKSYPTADGPPSSGWTRTSSASTSRRSCTTSSFRTR